MSGLRFAMLGTGFWSRFQLAGWQEIPGAKCVALYNRTRSKATALASEFGIPAVYDCAEELLRAEKLDFVDIVTDVSTHAHLVGLAAQHGLPVICQKPLAPSLEIAQHMLQQTRDAGVPLFVHENWRWQAPLRRLKAMLDSGICGQIIRARIDYANSFPVFENQPFLKELEQFILIDIGTHILDASRFLFGEASDLYCQTRKMHNDIAGEDVATVMMRSRDGVTITCNMSYASRWEFDRFPQTMVAVEGTEGGVSLGVDYELRTFGKRGSGSERVELPKYLWADPAYELVHTSIVSCHQNLFDALTERKLAETTGEDNLRTLQLVFAAYESAEKGIVVKIEA